MAADIKTATLDFHDKLWKAFKFLPAGADIDTPGVIEMCRLKPEIARLTMLILARSFDGKVNPNEYHPDFSKIPADLQPRAVVLGTLVVCYMANHPGIEPPELVPLFDEYPIISLCGGLVQKDMGM